MRRSLVVLAAFAAVAATAAPSTGDESPRLVRTVTAAYTVGVGIDCDRALGCVRFTPARGERYVVIDIRDASGAAVYATVTTAQRAAVQVFGDGDPVCGRSRGSHLVRPGRTVYVYFENHLGSWHWCPGGASTGTVTASFYR